MQKNLPVLRSSNLTLLARPKMEFSCKKPDCLSWKYLFFFGISITMRHNSYQLKEGMTQLHIRNTFFPTMINKYWNGLPKEAPVLSNLCPWIFSRLNQTKPWATLAECNVDPALCRTLDWKPLEVTSNLNGSMIYFLCICVAIIPIVEKNFFSLIVYSVTTLGVDWRFKTRAWSL